MEIVDFEILGAPVRGYLHNVDSLPRPAVVVCPGGGYDHLSPREADPPAMEFFTQGYQVFLLSYAVGEAAAARLPLKQLAGTVAKLRENADVWRIDPAGIAVLGFSAGGHLAATLGTRWRELSENARPDALILCYSVITMGEFTHPGTRDHVTGGDAGQREYFSVEKHIDGNFPPTFLWHTVDDASVSVENALILASALRKNGVPFECHLFAQGCHGLSVCTQEVGYPNQACRQWVQLCQRWLNDRFLYGTSE